MLPTYELSSSPDEQPPIPPRKTFSVWHTFKHHIPHFLITILVDVILPLVIYMVLQKHIRPVYALLVAGSPPLFMVILKALWFCTFDALGFLVFITFAISAIVAIVTHNAIILLLEKSLVTGVVSFIFAVTLIPFHCCHHRCRIRPLAYYMYQDLVPTNRADVGLPDNIFNEEQEQVDSQYTQLQDETLTITNLPRKQEVARVYEWIYTNCSSFRISCYLITSIWAIGLLLEFLARLLLILIHLPVNKIVIYGHIILSSITVICITSTVICITIERRKTLVLIEEWITKKKYAKNQEAHAPFVTVKYDLNSFSNVDA